METISAIRKSVTRAKRYLLAQARQDFAETRHEMFFPRLAGFRGGKELHSSDVFARAVLACILLDIIDLDADDNSGSQPLAAIVSREADYVAQAKLSDRRGGWSYFADLPDLPPDVDSFSAALRLFARAAPEHIPLCREPLQLALDTLLPDGSLETWLIAPQDHHKSRRRMQKGIKKFWGDGIHLDVCAHFYLALSDYDNELFSDILHQGARFIIDNQNPDGSWEATWYWGTAYGTALCLSFLDRINCAEEAHRRAIDFFLKSQRHNGGWGTWEAVPLDTALALRAIMMLDTRPHPNVIGRAVDFLLDYQCYEGHWNPSPWIKMDVGRAQGHRTHTLTYQSATLSTALCLRSLLQATHFIAS